MKTAFRLTGVALLTSLLAACAGAPQSNVNETQIGLAAMPGMQAPAGRPPGEGAAPRLEWAESLEYFADGPFTVDLSNIPARVYDPNNRLDRQGDAGRPGSPVSDEVADLMREESRLMPPNPRLQQLQQTRQEVLLAGPELLGPVAGTGFDSLDYTDCCGGGGNVPPDPELAVGPNHIIAVVNTAFEIYDKSGNWLSGPTTFSSFFSGTPGCSNTGVFDPNAIYDEEADRFILGIDGDGKDYCIAATTGSDPTGSWHTFAFVTDIGGNFFDYPHAGVGRNAIYMGANMFRRSGGFAEGRVWAIDKSALYSGALVAVKTETIGLEDTPQPMNLHGFNQGTWPSSSPHYILTDSSFNGRHYGVWSWTDPFGENVFEKEGVVDLLSKTGVSPGLPVDQPQEGSGTLQANDFRVQDAEYRNGMVWMTATIACNPGSGTVNCIQWAQIDPAVPTLIDAGVHATNGEYRSFPDLAVNDCDDMAVGFTKTSSSTFPSVYVSGRESGDTPGTLQSDVLLKAGEITYTSFESSSPRRWGDYTGMTIDPDGQTFWYLGEYSKDTGTTNGRWGTYIGSFTYPGCGGPLGPGKAYNPSPANTAVDVDRDSDLSWAAGSGAVSHNVYFGTVSTPGAGELVSEEQLGTTWQLDTLASSTTYYWRIDEVSGPDVTTGNVWSFTTQAEPQAPPTFRIADVAQAVVQQNGNRNRGQATVTVQDGTTPVSGVEVSGTFSGDWEGVQTGTTGADGKAVLQTPPVRNGTTFPFCVDNASKAGSIFDRDNSAVWLCGAPPITGAINGTVTIEGAGTPIPGAGVSTDTGESGTTDADGNYTLSDVPIGDRTVSASASGYDPNSAPTTVTEGNTSTVPIALTPVTTGGGTGILKGTVRDSSGTRLSGVLVEVAGGPSATTARNGRYTIRDVPEGSQTVTATLDDQSSTENVTIAADSTTTQDFTLTP